MMIALATLRFWETDWVEVCQSNDRSWSTREGSLAAVEGTAIGTRRSLLSDLKVGGHFREY